MQIRVDQKAVSRFVPGYVFTQAPFKFLPLGFSIDTKGGTNEVMFPKEVQEKGLMTFAEHPFGQQNYVLTGHLDDQKALYFAAFLIQLHLKKGGTYPVWHTFDSSFKTPEFHNPTMLVLSNLTTESSSARIEKCRDIIFKYWNIPKVIVACGIDPIRFGAMRLHIPVNRMAYFKSGLDVETVTIE